MATKAAPEGVPPPATSEAEAGEVERPAGEAGPAAGGPHTRAPNSECQKLLRNASDIIYHLSLCYVIYYLLLFF